MNRFITSVFLKDRVGILRDITQAVFLLEGNIGSIRQTVVEGFFTLAFRSEHPDKVSEADLRSKIGAALGPLAVVTVVACPEVIEPVVASGSRFVVTTRGEDKPGTIYAITSFLVDHGINIEHWMVEEDAGQTVYIAQVIIPDTIDFPKIQAAFRDAMAQRGLSALLCHENIFRATNEIGPIKALL